MKIMSLLVHALWCPCCLLNFNPGHFQVFAIEYFNENTSITIVFKFLSGTVLIVNPGVSGWVRV